MNITVAYITHRIKPHLDWFLDSLARQVKEPINIIIVDGFEGFAAEMTKPYPSGFDDIWHGSPKPSVWNGKHRLTAVDFFDQSNARNTALCLARHPFIAFVDDLSVLAPTWLDAVRECAAGGYVACGAFCKVSKLQVTAGNPVSFETYPQGTDPRWIHYEFDHTKPCPPQWSFGCSLAGPVEAFLKVNGYPEALTAGLGYEDCVTGEAIARHGYEFRYDRRMLTYESEEDHHNQPALLRLDPGVSPNDKSHRMLEIARGCQWFDNYFGDGFPDLRSLRAHIQNGGTFPIRKHPLHEWYSGWPLAEFHKYKA